MTSVFINGNRACAEGAIAAGCRFFAGYPISPATEIAEHMALRLPEVDGTYIQMEDEIASIAAVIGASYSGIKAMTATSGPGLDLMAENIGLAIMTESPCVIVDVMRGGPSTGQPTKPSQQDIMQAKWGFHGDHEIIALAPSTVQEMFFLTIEAFNLSEKYRTPVILLADAILGHLWEKLSILSPKDIKIVNRKKPMPKDAHYAPFQVDEDLVPPMACFGEGYHFYATGLTHNEYGFPEMDSETQDKLIRRLCDKIRKNAEKIIQFHPFMMNDAEIAVIAYGTPARSALSAIKIARSSGIKVGLLKLLTIWPFPDQQIRQIADKVKAIIVPEMNYGQIVREVERVAHNAKIIFLPKLGENPHKPSEILDAIEEVYKR